MCQVVVTRALLTSCAVSPNGQMQPFIMEFEALRCPLSNGQSHVNNGAMIGL